ncbi:MAG: hypothetical protein AVDCRST_MAG56-674 [uncultured Cytophagales bacterium]|uniref:VWFA domain-containing protein n=1 Tax=uncultured Cytophagales bacterium TaxID=158755 RepID=A0A6J4HB41_9SPHI|nr:MAG: hypothetical protein AVDCRST_MAG56-674 [uncultured Cytophagales bacterium]
MKTIHNPYPAKAASPLFALLLLLSTPLPGLYAQDKHIDPSPTKTLHTFSFTRHVNTPFTAAKAQNLLRYGTEILQRCDDRSTDDQDVACQVGFQMTGTVKTFGRANDNLDIINTRAELDTLLANNSGYVKIVTASMVDGNIQTAWASTPGSSLVMAAQVSGTVRDANGMGQTFVHEFGHNQGLGHRGDPGSPPIVGNPIMHPNFSMAYNEVNLAECAKYHNGHNAGSNDGPHRPVDIAFVIDDTGSMGEEINGVKNFLTLVLALPKFAENPCGTVFQLITYKDGVTVGAPTTNLSEIRAQVASLVASGGGDCPEASVEAIDAAKDQVKNNGLIYHATDAGPHPGLSLDGLIAALRSRGVTVSTILSGNCGIGGFTVANPSGQGPGVPYSDNKDATPGVIPTGGPADVDTDDLDAIEAFSLLARETGGLFAFVPEVNSGQPEDIKRYENIGYNIIVGGLSLSVTTVEPGAGPQGGELVVTINGSRTNFNAGSTVTFSDTNIAVSNVAILSPTRLQATLSIDPDAALGFKNITITTPLEGGGTETATGTGVFQVTEAPSDPTIVGITPALGAAGQQLEVTISGINTHFSDASELSLGSGITVLGTVAVGKEQLRATIKIDATAETGFRDVVVTTGTEVADEDVVGPFLVTLGETDTAQAVIRFTLVNADTDEDIAELKDNDTLNLAALPTRNLNIRANTNPDVVGSVLFSLDGRIKVENVNPYAYAANKGADYFAWTPGTGDHVLTATPYSEPTPYDSIRGSGEAGTPLTVHFHVIHQAIARFVLIDADSDQPITELKNGDVVDLGKLPSGNLNIQAVTRPGKVGSVVMKLDDKTVTENNAPYAYAGNRGNDYFATTLSPGSHQLSATPYSAAAGGGLKGSTSTVNFTVTRLVISELVLINADTDLDLQTIRDGDTLALAALPTGNLNIKAVTDSGNVGSVAFALDDRPLVLENLYPFAIGGDTGGNFKPWRVAPGKHRLTVTPYQAPGAGGTKGTPYTIAFTVLDGASAARLAAADPAKASFGILAAPNPFAERTHIRFSVPETGHATLQVFNLSGQPVARLFDANVEAGKAYQVEFTGSHLPGGIYVAKLFMHGRLVHYKLVLTR